MIMRVTAQHGASTGQPAPSLERGEVQQGQLPSDVAWCMLYCILGTVYCVLYTSHQETPSQYRTLHNERSVRHATPGTHTIYTCTLHHANMHHQCAALTVVTMFSTWSSCPIPLEYRDARSWLSPGGAGRHGVSHDVWCGVCLSPADGDA